MQGGRQRPYHPLQFAQVPVAGQEIGLLVLSLGVSQWVASLLVALFLIVCLLLILIVLIQRPQGGGLSGAFGAGGGGSGQTAFGAKTGDALTIATIAIFVLYLAIAVGLQFAARPSQAPAPIPAMTAGEGNGAGEQLPEDGQPIDVTDDGAAPVEDTGAVEDESTDEDAPVGTPDEAGEIDGETPDEQPETPEDDGAGNGGG